MGRQELFGFLKAYQLDNCASELQGARRRLRFLRPASLALILAFSFSSCTSNGESPSNARTVTDELGRVVSVPHQPVRIVSLAPSITETLFALGVGNRVAGVTSYCDYPHEASEKEKVGDTLKPNIEKIVALKADLVIISTSSQLVQALRRLEELRIPVYVSNPRNLEGVLKSIESIGDLVGARDRARELNAGLFARIETIERRLGGSSRARVLFMLGADPLITIGSGNFIDDLIRRAGGDSISADARGDYPQYSLETAVAKRPDVIFVQFDEKQLPERLKQTPAARAGRVYNLDDNLVSRPGPRIVDGLEQMATKIHPEVKW
jgi:iron complex transport system substrate-binding protein